MKPSYERPVIVRHVVGGANKFGAQPAMRVYDRFDGVPIADLVQQYGSPLFLISERTLRERFRELRDEMAARIPRFTLAWSYKTNYLGAVCRVFHQEGAWAEVVSGLELEMAVRLGMPGKQILFNGPAKSEADIEHAFRIGAHVHLDHLDEIGLAERVAERLGVRPAVGLRVNISSLPVPTWDRFGFNFENGSAVEAARRIAQRGHLELDTLHAHIGTFVQDADAYRLAAIALAKLAHELKENPGLHIDTIDLGGGFASRNTLQSQYLPGEQATPSLGQYVERIAAGLEEVYGAAPLPRVVLESGRVLVDDAGVLVATVVGNKRLTDGRRAVVLDAGVNLLPTAWWYRHDVFPAQSVHGTAEPTVFLGPLCMIIDVVRDKILFPPLRTGDRVVVGRVGAYNMTQWMQFIAARPNIVMVSPSGRHGIVRRAETVETLVQQEEMPAWLA
jgi:diaminopimelate decarboxylase